MREHLHELITGEELDQIDEVAHLADDAPATIFRIMNPRICRNGPGIDPILDGERLTGGKELLHLGHEWGESAVEANREQLATLLLRLQNTLKASFIDCEWLLDENG